MYAVVVTFTITSGAMPDFLPLILANAKTSLNVEAQCLQFDVATDLARPDEVFLYELYTDRAAFEAHLASAHFEAFDRAVDHMIAVKDVRTYATVKQ